MAPSAKSTSRRIAVDPRIGRVVNDNSPGIIPGHSLSDLDGIACQPSTEPVVDDGDLSEIASFPIHQAANTAASVPSIGASVERQVRPSRPTGRRVTFACFGSLLFHAALFATLVTTMGAVPEDPEEEAGGAISVVMLGDSDVGQTAAGEKNKHLEPEKIVAETVRSKVTQPVETAETEVQSTEAPPFAADSVEAAATEPVQQVLPETIASAEPEVLTLQVPAETTVAQTAQVQPAETPPAQVAPSPVQPMERAVDSAVPPVQPVIKIVERRPDVVKKQPPKSVKAKSGSEGSGVEDKRKGLSDGREDGQSNANSQSAVSSAGAGSAAVANYPGKIGSRIRRSLHVPEEYKRMTALLNVRIRMTIGAGGEIAALSVARSSGVPELDSSVIDGVRRAAPFPPLPPEWGKPSWSFTQEVQVTGD
ncbi:cell envelope integrity protein TolA [Rhizobium sp. 2YAF20]|uniref:cell envelope integrity protein TolA n=1 Tax=Rhizobium sp. 2YAF20 TaxID=3233027 RepID=UPI003F998166